MTYDFDFRTADRKRQDEEQALSLACKLDAGPTVRWRSMSACKLTYEENEPEYLTVWVSEPRRTAVLDDITDTQPFSIKRSMGVLA